MKMLECIIMYGSIALVSSLASLSHLPPLRFDLYYFNDVRDGEIAIKRDGLLQICQHAVAEQ